jgi:dTDP-glucose 4,6-dehydratase
MRVLVTGGAGFIGSAVCHHFILDLGHDVGVMDKLTYAGNLASLASVAADPRFFFEKHDICDVDAINAIFAKYRPDAVVHLAAESHVDRSISGSDIFVKTNVLGIFTLLEAARKYVSSGRRNMCPPAARVRKEYRFQPRWRCWWLLICVVRVVDEVSA